MKKSQFTEEQMVTILREADRTTVAETAKKHKIGEPTIYAWRKHFGQMEATDVKRLKALELENNRLNGMWRATPSYALRMPDKDAPVIAAMQELSAQHPRYGYRRIRTFLRRKGFELSWSQHALPPGRLEALVRLQLGVNRRRAQPIRNGVRGSIDQ